MNNISKFLLQITVVSCLACVLPDPAAASNAGDNDQDIADDIGLLPDVKFKNKPIRSARRVTFDSLSKKPVEGGVISSNFGWRQHPVLNEKRFHTGVDYAVPEGTEVHAAEVGTIIFQDKMGRYGNLLVIQHNEKFKTYYAHLSKFVPGLKVGSSVQKNELVAYTGNTGLTTGPHIHYEIRQFGKPVDPLSGSAAPDSIFINKGYIQKIPGAQTSRLSGGRYRTIFK